MSKDITLVTGGSSGLGLAIEYEHVLHKIRKSPSETSTINVFLYHLMKEVHSSVFALNEVLDRAKYTSALILKHRKNFGAFRRISEAVIDKIERYCGSCEEAEEVLCEVLEQRASLSVKIAEKWSLVIKKNDNLLTLSQSVRVAELLRGAPSDVQDTCQIFIAECRTKSPVAFQDALAILDSLRDTGYALTLTPDACTKHLMKTKSINKILIGAHLVYMSNDKPKYYINTCGTSQLLDCAIMCEIPVYIIAESFKIVELVNGEEPKVFFEEEEGVFECVLPGVSALRADGIRVNTLNIGYDLCQLNEGVFLVTEDGIM